MAVQAALTGHLVFSHAAHQRCALGHHAPDGAGRARLPHQRDHAGRAGAAPGAHPVQAVPPAGRGAPRARRWTPSSSPGRSAAAAQPYKPVGCVDCRMTGFMGRMGLYELLTVSEAFKEKVTQEPIHRRPAPAGRGRRHAAAAAGRRAAGGRGPDDLEEVLSCHAAARLRQQPGRWPGRAVGETHIGLPGVLPPQSLRSECFRGDNT